MRALATMLLVSTVTLACSSTTTSIDSTKANEGSSATCDRDENGNCIDWAAEATARGFETAPDDFYRFLEFACNVEPAEPPASLEELWRAADLIGIGRVTAIVAQRRDDPVVPYAVALELTLDDVVKGVDSSTQVTVPATCAHAGKVEGLRNSRPDSSALFVLTASTGDDKSRFNFAFHYLGAIIEQGNSLSFPLVGDSQELDPPSLKQYSSISELTTAL